MTSRRNWQFRSAVEADLSFIESLRNDAESVRFSRRGVLSSDVVRDDFLGTEERSAFIACVDADDVGYARFDFEPCASGTLPAEISIALDAALRGKGMGAGLVAEATAFAFGRWDVSELRALRATVHAENAASLRCFANAGYRSTDDEAVDARPFQDWMRMRGGA
jgi:RimJ/RimL family protein N-acetyltransferase